MSKASDALNVAFQADANAVQALVINRVPCNQFLADDQFVIVESPPTLAGQHFQVGALGLVNAVLAASGLPLVALQFSEPDADGVSRLLGFCDYTPPEVT